MQKRWYLSALLVVLTLVGVSLDQMTVPNQELVVHFSSSSISSEDTEDAIAIVTAQLENLGAEQIYVKESADGLLKITYYSTADVAFIKRNLAKAKQLDLGITAYSTTQGSTGFPSETPSKVYELDVFEITQLSDYGSDINGVAHTIESKITRFYVQDVNVFSTPILISKSVVTQEVAYSFQKTVALTIDTPHFIIPEVRAGPLS
jgi:hypothetical protein